MSCSFSIKSSGFRRNPGCQTIPKYRKMPAEFNSREESNTLMDEMQDGSHKVGIRFARKGKPNGSIFFEDIASAETTVRRTLLSRTVKGCWIGCLLSLYRELDVLLEEISTQRRLIPYTNIEKGVIVYDLL